MYSAYIASCLLLHQLQDRPNLESCQGSISEDGSRIHYTVTVGPDAVKKTDTLKPEETSVVDAFDLSTLGAMIGAAISMEPVPVHLVFGDVVISFTGDSRV